MAAPDYPRGFWPVAKYDGSPFSGMIRSMTALDGADCFMYDVLFVSSNTIGTSTGQTDTVAGVAVGFGRKPSGMFGNAGPFNPLDLEAKFYDDSASTNTEWTVFYVPASGVFFEGQEDGAGTQTTDVGDTMAIVLTAGNQTTGISNHEIDSDTTTNGRFRLIQSVTRPGYGATDTNAAWLGHFPTTL